MPLLKGENLITSIYNEDIVFLQTTNPRPLFSKPPSFSFTRFGDPHKLNCPYSCMALSPDSHFLVLGYLSGFVNILSIPSGQIVKTISTESSNPIKTLCFTQDGGAFLISDYKDNVYQVTIGQNKFKLENNVLFTHEFPVNEVFKPFTDSRFLLISSDSVFDLINLETRKVYDVASSAIGEPIHFVTRQISQSALIVIYHGYSIHFFIFNSPNDIYAQNLTRQFSDQQLLTKSNSFSDMLDSVMTPLYDTSFEDPIFKVLMLNNSNVACILETGEIKLFLGLGQGEQSIRSLELVNSFSLVKTIPIPYGQNVLYLSPKQLFLISFVEWKDYLITLSKMRDWNSCFSLASGIFSGTQIHLFGIPTLSSERCLQIRSVMKNIFRKALESIQENVNDEYHSPFCKFSDNKNESSINLVHSSTTTLVSNIFKTAMDLDMPEVILEMAFDTLTIKKRLDIYFGLLFTPSYYALADGALYAQCLNFFSLHDDLSTCENLMLHLQIPLDCASNILHFAQTYDLEKLMLYLWINVYNDIISPCIYLYQKGVFPKYLYSIFIAHDLYVISLPHLQLIILWLFTPMDNTFPRVAYLFENNYSNTLKYVKSFHNLLPIRIKDGTEFDAYGYIDALLRVFSKCQFSDIKDAFNYLIEDILYPLTTETKHVPQNQQRKLFFSKKNASLIQVTKKTPTIPACSLKMVVEWIFKSTSSSLVRENLLMIIHKQYPFIINYKDMIDNCQICGFSDIVKNYYEPTKNYSKIITTMGMSEFRRKEVYPYVESHLDEPEMFTAFKENSSLLILIDSKKFVDLVIERYPQFHEDYLKRSLEPYLKFIYLKAIASTKLETPSTDMEAFELTCKYAPSEALSLLTATHSIRLDQALPICLRYRVIDACIHIHTMLGNYEDAVQLVGDELERILVLKIRSGVPLRVQSIDLVGEDESLKDAYKTVLLVFKLLEKTPEVGQNLEKMWQNIFLRFRLPLWLSKSIPDLESKRSITYFFAFFVVESLARTNPQFTLGILKRDFSSMDPGQYKKVLQVVFQYLNDRRMLNTTVKSLLLADCIELSKRAIECKTKGKYIVQNTCVICQQPINGAGSVGMIAFDCGHVYHDNLQCGNYSKCPMCKGEIKSTGEISVPPTSERSNRMKSRLLSRIEFGLKRHYGKDQDISETGKHVFFVTGFPVKVTNKIILNLPKVEPTPIDVYLEL